MPYEEWEGYNPFHALATSVSFGELRRLAYPVWCGRVHAPETCGYVAQRDDGWGLHWLLYAPLTGGVPAVFFVELSMRGGRGDVFAALALAAGGKGRGGDSGFHGVVGISLVRERRWGGEVVYIPPGEHSIFPGY